MQFLSDSHGCQGWSGEMAERILAYDWSRTDLGPLGTWSPSLRSAAQFLLASPVPLVMLWGRAGNMIYNDAYSVFAGGRHPYLLGTPVELGWPEVADFNRNIVDTCLAGGTLTYRDKSLVLLRHGVPEELWFDLYYSPVPGDDGAPAGVMAVVVEITDRINAERQRHEAEDAYRATNERLQLALNTGALLGCFVWDIGANEVTGDARFARTFSLSAESVQRGVPIESATVIIHPDDVERVSAAIAYTVENGGPYSAEYRIRRPDDSYLWILASGRCELDEQGKAQRFPGVLIDIHERKIAEEALLKLTRNLEQRVSEEVQARSVTEERLRQSQKLEAIGGLTGGVAHDFNNVLQVIGGNLQLLARKERDNPNVQRHVNAALGAVERGAKLSAQLLAFARRQPLSPAVYSPQRIYEGMGELLQRALGETIQIDVQLPVAPWSIHVDRNQLENALLNLAINARDAMRGEGTILLGGENVILNATQCQGKDIVPGDYVRLAVSDSGVGMSAETLRRAFEPFFTTKPDGQGTGLGLSMVFGFVKQSGGHIEMSSEEGSGTTVLMYFPRSQETMLAEESEEVDLLVGGQETILVVEDDDAVRSTTVELLQQLGYSVLLAVNGDAALELLQGGAQVDLVFTDVVMPGQVKSIDLAIWARQQTPPIPVLFTSGHTRDIISRDNELDADTYLLSKPYSPDALTSMVRMVLNA